MTGEQVTLTRRHMKPGAAGFTLVEMLAAVALMMLLGGIVYVVFLSAQTVSSDSNALTQTSQVAQGIFKVMESDISGAWLRRDKFTRPPYNLPGLVFYCDENSELDDHVNHLPPLKETTNRWDVKVSSLISPPPPNEGLVFLTTVGPAGGEDRSEAKVMYLLKANGDLVRGVQYDEVLGDLDYTKATSASEEEDYVIARHVTALQFRFLGKDAGQDYWENIWKYQSDRYGKLLPSDTPKVFRRHLPRAVEVKVRICDRKGLIKSDDDVRGEPRLGIWFTQVIAIPGAGDWPRP